MILKSRIALTALGVMLIASSARADELNEMGPEIAQGYGKFLTELFSKADGLQVKFEVDTDKAVGLVREDEGIILVPRKGLKDGDEPDPAVGTEKGAGLAYLFLSQRFNPTIDGKPVDGAKLRKLKLPDEREATALLVSVRRVGDDDWRLYVFGADAKPLIDTSFAGAADNKGTGINVKVRDPKNGIATLVVNLFGKYEAGFPIGHKFD